MRVTGDAPHNGGPGQESFPPGCRRLPPHRYHCTFLSTPAVMFPFASEFLKHLQSMKKSLTFICAMGSCCPPPIRLQASFLFPGAGAGSEEGKTNTALCVPVTVLGAPYMLPFLLLVFSSVNMVLPTSQGFKTTAD